jgi:hypothetical protein
LSDEAGIRMPGGSGGVDADEKPLQPAVFWIERKCSGLFMDRDTVELLCNAMRAVHLCRRLGVVV